MTWEGPNPSKHCDSFAGARSSQMGRFHYWRRLLKHPQIHKGSICGKMIQDIFGDFGGTFDRPGHEQFPVSIECRPVCPAYVCWVVYSIISYYFFVTALSLSTSLNPLCCWGSNFLAGRKGSQVFGAVWEAQKRAAWQDWTRISPYISWTISGMLRLENAQNAACCHLLPSHSAGTFFEVLEPRPWLTIVTTSWR